MPDWLTLDWFRDNRDAALAIAALAGPIVAVIGTLLSFKAVTTVPRVQREIARETAMMTQEIARDTARRTQTQITASLYAAADHQWITDFRAVMAEIMALTTEVRVVKSTRRLDAEATATFTRKFTIAMAQLRLMVSSESIGSKLAGEVGDYVDIILSPADPSEDEDRTTGAVASILPKAMEMIRQREARLATYLEQRAEH
jgi:dihydroxyacetone kinase-like predicted kinase